MKFVRVENGKVEEVVISQTLDGAMHPELAKKFFVVRDDVNVGVGWHYDGNVFSESKPLKRTLSEAIAIGEAYIGTFFEKWQRDLMLAIASQGSDTQKEKCKAILEWILMLLTYAELDPANFKPTGTPPYRWEDLK